MIRWIVAGAVVGAVGLSGCASGLRQPDGRPLSYRVTNDECDCTRYVTADSAARIVCEFAGTYQVGVGITTSLSVTIGNQSPDTLDLSLSSVKIASRNLAYRYNDKFLPMSIAFVAPGDRQTVKLIGEAQVREGTDPWLLLAGEELVLTIKGMRIQGRLLAPQVVRFIPTNPKFTS